MKKLTIPFVLLLFPFFLIAQSSYNEAIQQGDVAFNKEDYKTAINKYFAAEAFDPTKKEVVKAKVNLVFDKIEKLKNVAEKERKNANKARVDAEKSKQTSDSLYHKADKLVKAFYFYADRFALAFKNDNFYFIDENGNEVKKLGKWEKAEQFEWTGFAKVTRIVGPKQATYLLDTLGAFHSLAFDLEKVYPKTEALDLSRKLLRAFPKSSLGNTQIKVLLLNGNQLSKVPNTINKWVNLTALDLSYNDIKSLPDNIQQLTKLTKLDLRGNPINSTESKRIRQLLPNCEIKFSMSPSTQLYNPLDRPSRDD